MPTIARNAFLPVAKSRMLYVCSNSVSLQDIIPLTVALVAQKWQMKTCPAPEHNAGPLTSRLGITLLVIGAVCIVCRFLARWRIQNSIVGWDDWTILFAYVLLIPSTILIEISQSSQPNLIALSTDHADFVLLVAHNGMGKDIWNVPFEDITMMLKVSRPTSSRFKRRSTELTLRCTGLLDRAVLLPSRRCRDKDLDRPAIPSHLS